MSSGSPRSEHAAVPPSPPTGTVLDPGVLHALADGDEAFLRELATEFARSAARADRELAAALEGRDLATLAEVAHRFKSAAAQVGAHAAAALAAALERLGRGGTAAPEADAALVEAERLVTALRPVLAALEVALHRIADAPADVVSTEPRREA